VLVTYIPWCTFVSLGPLAFVFTTKSGVRKIEVGSDHYLPVKSQPHSYFYTIFRYP
jgi:hypothetical protein